MKTTVIALLALSLCSCACLVNGTKQQVQINSNPDGADISVNGIPYGQTPNTIQLHRKQTHQVQLAKKGYTTTSHSIDRRLSGWVWVDFYFLIIPGFVDLGVGSAYTLDPEAINAQLEPVAGGPKQ